MTKGEINWKDFEMSVNLHKNYLDLVIKLNLFYYAITGAILSFHFTNQIQSVSIISLILPILMSLLLGVFLIYASKLAWNLRGNIKIRAEKLNLHVYPEGIVLVTLCAIFGTIMLTVGLGLLYYLASGKISL
jgi:H+/Cl- antiporter ClcA